MVVVLVLGLALVERGVVAVVMQVRPREMRHFVMRQDVGHRHGERPVPATPCSPAPAPSLDLSPGFPTASSPAPTPSPPSSPTPTPSPPSLHPASPTRDGLGAKGVGGTAAADQQAPQLALKSSEVRLDGGQRVTAHGLVHGCHTVLSRAARHLGRGEGEGGGERVDGGR